jgi:hypothetical protein
MTAELSLHNLPLRDGFELFKRFKARDPDAIDTAQEMFPANSACFLCDEPVGTDFDLWVSDDPQNPRLAVLSPICTACTSQPMQVRLRKLRDVMGAIWPKTKHQVRLAAPHEMVRR